MSDVERIVLTAATTILGGFFVFVGGHLASRFFIEAWYEQRKVIGSIAEALLNYAHLFAASGEAPPGAQEAALRLRQLTDTLLARTMAVPGYGVLVALRVAPRLTATRDASRGLVRLSTTLSGPDWRQKMLDASQVAVNLGIDGVDPGSLGKDFADKLRKDP